MSKSIMIIASKTSYTAKYNLYAGILKELNENQDKVPMVDASDFKGSQKKMRNHLEKGGILVSIDGEGISEKHSDKTCLLDEFSGQIVVYFVSHPSFYNKNISEYPKEVRIFCWDQSYVDYLKNVLGREAGFMPFVGLNCKKNKASKEKNKSVLFAGSYLNPEDTRKQLEDITPKIMTAFMKDLIKDLETNPLINIEDALEQNLIKHGATVNKELVRDMMNEFSFLLIEYQVRFLRKKTIECLVDNQVEITLVGQHWDIFADGLSEDKRKYVYVIGEAASIDNVASFMRSYKVILDISPELKGGVHERVDLGLRSGNTVLVADNPYTRELAKSHEKIVLYDLAKPKAIVKRVKKIIEDDSKTCVKYDIERSFADVLRDL